MPRKTPRSLRQVLEAALVKNPDDLATHAAYADHLTEQGDPRGEFIQVQLALEDASVPAPARKKLQQREQALLKKHTQTWLGSLAKFLLPPCDIPEDGPPVQDQFHFEFARGWLNRIHIPMLTGGCAAALAAAPETRLLRQLIIRWFDTWRCYADLGEDRDFPGLEPLAEARYLRNVQIFEVGGSYDGGKEDFTYHSTDGLAVGSEAVRLVEKLPRLRELYLNTLNSLDAEALFSLPTLKRLQVLQYTLGERCPLRVLAANPALKHLTSLLVHPQAAETGEPALITLPDVRALLSSPHLTKLRQLRLHQTDMGDAGATAIVRSGILKRLKHLDISYGCLSDQGAQTLAACPELRHLELLDVRRNALTAAGIAALTATGITILADDQSGDPADRSYLYEGDWE